MKKWLNNAYINPQSRQYLCLVFLQHYAKRLFCLAFIIIHAYPSILLCHEYYQHRYLYKTEQLLSAELVQQEKLLQSLRNKKSESENRDKDFSEVNRKITQIAEQYQIKIEHIQWQFEKGKQASLVLSQRSASLFEMIKALDKLPSLYFNELILFKLHQARLIQLQAQFTFE